MDNSYVSLKGMGKYFHLESVHCKHNTEFGSHKQVIAGHTSNPNIGEVETCFLAKFDECTCLKKPDAKIQELCCQP